MSLKFNHYAKWCVTCLVAFYRVTLCGGVKCTGQQNLAFSINISLYPGNTTRQGRSYYRNRMFCLERAVSDDFQWPSRSYILWSISNGAICYVLEWPLNVVSATGRTPLQGQNLENTANIVYELITMITWAATSTAAFRRKYFSRSFEWMNEWMNTIKVTLSQSNCCRGTVQ